MSTLLLDKTISDPPPDVGDEVNINYAQEPTPALLHADNTSRVRGIMGPIGSGKTVACVMELFMRAINQAPFEGVRRTKFGVFRNTYGELRATTIATLEQWLSPLCTVVYTTPIEGRMRFPLPDGTTVESMFYFASLDKPRDVQKIMSWDLTGGWFNEARFMSWETMPDLDGRIGRYPPENQGGWTWRGIILDTNAPDMDSWWYRKFEEERPVGWRILKQPGALKQDADGQWIPNPAAENVANHTGGFKYWLDQLPGKDPEWIRVMIGGEYGYLYEGKPVYEGSYNDAVHFSTEPLEVFTGLPIHLGWDFGKCACVIAQLTTNGQARVLRECIALRSGGIGKFVREQVRPVLANDFPNMKIGSSTGDPAGFQTQQTDGLHCINVLNNMGIPTLGASTQDVKARIESVMEQLCFYPDGAPGMVVDPSCTMLRKGFLGAYRFERVQIGGPTVRHHLTPAKTDESHVHDALQYLMLGLLGKKRKGGGVYVPQNARDAWD